MLLSLVPMVEAGTINRQSMTGLQHDSALMAREKPAALNLARWLRPDRSAHGVEIAVTGAEVDGAVRADCG